ncbi:portal protein [Vibrio sp. SCSIO 43137]|uniref:portal protein n=1 Tax=Vibrio sp. SCSIO 43137 TaxID=3021011 RepID=UPI0023077AB4|nr:portal protein [Vibrio sp. SCSIO 43137]WCE31253.1 portal protein [Vibrio sp. SCSIO 43137]
MSQSPTQQLYTRLKTERDPYLTRGRLCAGLTIPSLLPEEGQDENTQFAVPYSGFGARAVKQLASKIVTGLFPPSHPFVRLMIPEDMVSGDITDDQASDLEKALSQTEGAIVQNMERRALRSHLFEVVKHLLVTGNGVLKIGTKSVRFYRLDKYVVMRDNEGEVIKLIICEKVNFKRLDDKTQAQVVERKNLKTAPRKDVTVYTVVELRGNTWYEHQECEGIVLPKSKGRYRKDRCPYIVSALSRLDGEDYGRSFCEEHLGDLNTLESLVKAITQASVAASKVLFLVKPNSSTRATKLAKAKNGDFLQGNPDDIGCLQLDKAHDLAMAQQLRNEINQALSEAFLMTSAVRRDAERVTAEEIRAISQMLEEGLGGMYSQLAQSLQLPLVHVLLGHMERDGTLPHFKEETFTPIVITGVEGIGRSADLQRLNTFVGLIQQVGADKAESEMNLGELFKRYAASLQIETDGLMRTEEEKAAFAQQQQATQFAQQNGGQLLQMAQGQQ